MATSTFIVSMHAMQLSTSLPSCWVFCCWWLVSINWLMQLMQSQSGTREINQNY